MGTSTGRIIAISIFFTLLGATLVALNDRGVTPTLTPGATAQPSGNVREYQLDMQAADIDMGNGAIWHAWTYNGTVPGPTITATVGDVVRVTVHNSLDATHSFHTHFSPYAVASDGSQLNTITGIGGMAMIPPGGTYMYEFFANVPGLMYYHDHSAEGGGSIHANIAQGLYGAILVKAIGEPPIDDQVVFMSERGFNVTKPDAPFYIMNGMGLPGGEAMLMKVFDKYGVPGVEAQLGHTLPVLSGRVGIATRINVVNIGDIVHSFHLHGMTAYLDDGKILPAQVLGLDPGEADRITITPTEAGLWLFHCHVVSHADGGMIGVLVVQPKEGSLQLPPPLHMSDIDFAALANDTAMDMGNAGGGATSTSASAITIVAGPTGHELTFSPANATIEKPGHVTVTFKNEGKAVHSLSFPALHAETPAVPPGGSATLMLDITAPGAYAFLCTQPAHADAGMTGTLTVGGA